MADNYVSMIEECAKVSPPYDRRRFGVLLVLTSSVISFVLLVSISTALLSQLDRSAIDNEQMARNAESLQNFSTAAGPGD